MDMNFYRCLIKAILLLTTALLSLVAMSAPSPAATQQIAEEGYIYGFPIVMNYAVMYDYAIDRHSDQFKAPFNVIKSMPRVYTYKDTSVITPNSDTPYSFVSMDLRAEPMVLSVPKVEKSRYYSVMLCDGNTYNFGYIGSRATGTEAGNYLVVGPNWHGQVPPGINKVFRSSTWFAAAAYRTQLFNPQDMPNVIKVQAGYKAQPLSAYLKQPAPPAAADIEFPKINKKLIKKNFFEYLHFVLQFAPADKNEIAIREKLKKLSSTDKSAILLGMQAGQAKINKSVENAGTRINGWRVGGAGGDRDYYDGNWLLRAGVAQAGIYANDAVEAMYPFTRTDGNGKPLDGSKYSYTLTFADGQFPPVNAFWSITMYDAKTQLLIKNPINRYLINSPMLSNMKLDAKGNLIIYIQHTSPGKDKESNWLPAPNGAMYIVMRLYWPKKTPPSILPPGKGTWNPPPIVRSN